MTSIVKYIDGSDRLDNVTEEIVRIMSKSI